MAVSSLSLVRHGQSRGNAGEPTSSTQSMPLTALGQEQAVRVAAQLSRQPDLIVVSPYVRAQQTAAPVIARWPDARAETWPIQEFTYLEPGALAGTTAAQRRPRADAYWRRANPHSIDGPGAESFADLVDRVVAFATDMSRQRGLVVAIGHGWFFGAFLLAKRHVLEPSSTAMSALWTWQQTRPMLNGQIIRLTEAVVAGPEITVRPGLSHRSG